MIEMITTKNIDNVGSDNIDNNVYNNNVDNNNDNHNDNNDDKNKDNDNNVENNVDNYVIVVAIENLKKRKLRTRKNKY